MKYFDKRFLSERSDEGGSIRWTVDSEEKYNNELIITDCDKTIYLDIEFSNNKQIDKKVKKVDNLIESLIKCRQALLSCKTKPKKYYY